MSNDADANRNYMNRQLAEIQRLLGEHGAKLDGIDKKVDETRQSVRDIWRSQNEQDKQIAKLETKAGVAGFIGGGIITAIILGVKWLAGK